MNFDQCFERLMLNEGGFTANPKDRGNWTGGNIGVGSLKGTKWGIAAASYPMVDIKELTKDQAKAIYQRDFWSRLKLDGAPELARFQIFDAAVNHGIKRAVKLTQEALGVVVDGVAGPVTLKALRESHSWRFVLKFNAARIRYYTSLSSFADFGKGWVNRVADNQVLAANESLDRVA